MNDLVQQIIEKTGIPADKAEQVLGVVANFVKQKFPAIGSQIESVLGAGGNGEKVADDGPLGGIGKQFGL